MTQAGVCVHACSPLHYVDKDTPTVCRACDERCAGSCTGPSNHNCTSCAFPSLITPETKDFSCLDFCPTGYYGDLDTLECKQCHDQCSIETGCYGPLATNCIECALPRHHDTCVSSCPVTHYIRELDHTCQPCHSECDASQGCTGPLASECTACLNFNVSDSCLPSCPLGLHTSSAKTCVECDRECRSGCSGAGPQACIPICLDSFFTAASKNFECLNSAAFTSTCVATCPALTFVATTRCFDCHKQCSVGCVGPADTDCLACAQSRYQNKCVASCPTLSFTKHNNPHVRCPPRAMCGRVHVRLFSIARHWLCCTQHVWRLRRHMSIHDVCPERKLHFLLRRVSEWMLGPDAVAMQQFALSQQHSSRRLVCRVVCRNTLHCNCASRFLPQSSQHTEAVSCLPGIVWYWRLL
jgi:hypothetical protein